LLEAMQEHSVTIGGQTYILEEPFFVLATQNPIEQEGTYPLPEAQKDRFMFHIKVDYPSKTEEEDIIKLTTGSFKAQIQPVISGAEIVQCQEIVRKVPVPDHVRAYVLDIVRGCRPDDAEALPFTRELISWGPGPRACQQLVLGGKVRAILKGRPNVTSEDIAALAHPVLRHRIIPTFNADAEGITVNHIIDKVLQSVPQQPVGATL
jgi:MoxR-like ATPase